METLWENETLFYASLFDRKEELLDEGGNPTGQYQVFYTDPKPYKGNVSKATGETATYQFGDLSQYDKVIVFDDVKTPINEYTILWVDSMPQLDGGKLVLDEDGNAITPHDYIAKEKSASINVVALAVKKVNVT